MLERAIVLLAGIAIGFCETASGAPIKSKSPSRPDVAAAIESANDGDTIEIPAGTADWDKTVNVTKGVTIQGAGIGQTIIQDNVLGTKRDTSSLLNLCTVKSKLYRVTGIEFAPAKAITGDNRHGGKGMVRIAGDSVSVRIDHCKFVSVANRGCAFFNAALGVIDHCEFVGKGVIVNHQEWGGGQFGDQSFADDANFGSADAVYVEDCKFVRAVMDAQGGSRYVFRHNMVIDGTVVTHGSETKGPLRGTRMFEIYDNIFTSNHYRTNAVFIRSGSGVIFNNTVSNYKNFCMLNHYRALHDHFYWGISDGRSPWDDNLPGGPFEKGTHTGENDSKNLTDATKNWQSNQWVGYSILNTTTGRASVVMSNNSNTILEWPEAGHIPSQGGGHMMTFNKGDSYEFWRIRNAMDMPGMGKSDLLAPPKHPRIGFPHQAIEGIYGWNNKMNGAPARIICPKYPFIVESVHYFNDKQKPGYKPFVYPHPLTKDVSR